MTTLGERLGLLRRLRPALRRAAVVASVRAARGTERADILLAALEDARSEPDLVVGLAGLWPELPPEARDALIRSSMGDPVRIVDRLGTGGASIPHAGAAFAARALAHSDLSRPHALALGARLATHLRATQAPAWVLDEVARACRESTHTTILDEPLTVALERFPDHRHEPVLAAALRIAPSPGPRFRAWLTNTDDPAHFALRSAVRRLPTPSFLELAMPLLGAPALAPIAAARIATFPHHESASLLAQGHRLRIRSRGAVIHRASGAPGLMPAPDHPVGARRGAIDWIRASNLSPVARCAHLGARLTDADASVRLRAVRALRELPPTPTTDRTLMDFALDAAEPVARAATAILASAPTPRRREALYPDLRTLARSPHASVRSRAERAMASLGFTELAPHHRAWHSPIAAKKALRADQSRVIRELSLQVSAPNQLDRLDAIRLIDRLALVAECRAPLLGALDDPDARVVASAVRTLARQSDTQTHLALVRALGHSDARVRANALEELHRTPGSPPASAPRAEAFTDDPVPRIRANALHALLRRHGNEHGSRSILGSMLTDSRAAHRRSGLWVVERLAILPMAPVVADIVRNETDTPVRHRAIRCGKRLLDHLLAASSHAAHTSAHADTTSS